MKNQIEKMKNELAEAINDEFNEESVSLTRALLGRGEKFSLEVSDGAFEELSEGPARWVTSERKLTCGDQTIAQWTVAGVGDFDDKHCGAWECEEDRGGSDGVNPDSALKAVLSVLDAAGEVNIDDAVDIPHVPEPRDIIAIADGQYAVVYTDDAPGKNVLARFATEPDAQKTVDRYYRQFRSANGNSAYLADGGGWEVAKLIDGEWEMMREA